MNHYEEDNGDEKDVEILFTCERGCGFCGPMSLTIWVPEFTNSIDTLLNCPDCGKTSVFFFDEYTLGAWGDE